MNTSKEIRLFNLKSLVAEFKTIEAVAQRAETPAVYLSQILNGVKSSTGTTRGVGNALARKLELGCDKPTGWMDGNNDVESNIDDGPNFKTTRQYPVISLVQAGEWTELCDNFAPGDASEWRPCHRDLGESGYIVRVKGKSMTATEGESYTFPEGILLYVNPEQEPLPGKFVIVRRNRTLEATFKKFILVDGEPYLEAINPNWPNRYLKIEEGDHFCGVVMHAGFDMP
jgi:SOS-response transcriptional repressor LexA